MSMVSWGATISVNDGAASAQQVFTEVQLINFPFPELQTSEDTHLTSANRWRTFIAGMRNPPEFSWEQNYSETDYARLVAIGITKMTWKITDPQTSSPYNVTWDGFLTKVELAFETRGETSIPLIKATVKLTGAPTFA